MRKVIFSCLLVSFVFSLNAQTKQKSEFTPNVYVGLYGGLSAFLGEGNTPFQSPNTFSFNNNVKWGSALAIGYDWSSVLGIRFELGYAQHKWANLTQNNQIERFWLESLTADLMVNMSNLIWGYNPDRRFDVQIFVGGGGGNTDYTSNSRGDLLTPIVRVGLQGSYHVSRNLDINLDLATNGVTDNYNDVKAGLGFDDVSSVMLGVAYRFKDKPEAKPKPMPAPVPVPEPAPAPKPAPAPQPAPAPAPVQKAVEQPKPIEHPVVKEEVVKKITMTAKNVFFVTGKAELQPASKTELMEIVKIMNDDKDIKLAINGYTDNTGKADLNQQLSENRAMTVKQFLISKGISAERLQSHGFGMNNPIASNKTAAGRQQNRRVELVPSY